jgi:tight adherence protein B
MSIAVITLLSFLAATGLVLASLSVVQSTQRSPQVRIRRRLVNVAVHGQAAGGERQDLAKRSVYSEIPAFHQVLNRYQAVRSLNLLLDQADLNVSVGMFILLSLTLGIVACFITSTVFVQPFGSALLSGGLISFVPFLLVKYLARKRIRRFLEQLPDGLDIMAQGLQAGLGLSQAQAFVAKEMPAPLGTEFAIFMEELNLGQSIGKSLENLQERMPLPEVRMFSTALLVQRDIGGSLAELLNKLAEVIRDRFRIERDIKTLTAQNRIAAVVVCSLPPALFAFMFMMNAKLMNEVMASRIGQFMLTAALVLELLGILWFRYFLRLHI